jgi:hypothetical protein
MFRISVIVCILLGVTPVACTEATVLGSASRQRTTGETQGDETTPDSDAPDSADSDSDISSVDTHETSDTENPDETCSLDVTQEFTNAPLPKGWSIVDGDSDGYTWQWADMGNNIGVGSGAGHYWIDAASAGPVSLDEQLTTEEFDRGGCASVRLYFTHRFDRTSDQGRVSIQVDGGAWKSLHTFYADDSGSKDINLTSFLGSGKKFRLQFSYEGVGTQYWRVDDVRIVGN